MSRKNGWIAVGIVLLTSAACQERSNERDQPPTTRESRLYAVSPLASVLHGNLANERNVACVMADSFKRVSKQPQTTEADKFTERLTARLYEEARFVCELLSNVQRFVEPTYDQIAATGQVPKPLYVFSIFQPCCESEEEAHQKMEIGLFPTIQECEQFETEAHDFGLPTRRCEVWGDELDEFLGIER